MSEWMNEWMKEWLKRSLTSISTSVDDIETGAAKLELARITEQLF